MYYSADPMTSTTYDSTDSVSDTVHLWGHPVYVSGCKSEEDDLWMIVDRREWREHTKALWMYALGAKHYFCAVRYLVRVLYYRRLLFSISGWLGRKGYAKKN